jgi:transcriptional regulator with XRE-family HTH domain
MNIGARIRDARQRQRLSQGELADRAEINRTYLSQLENGRSSPTLEVLERIARALGVETAELISEAQAAREPEPQYETVVDVPAYQGLQEFLDDERTRLLMKPTPEEIEVLKSIRFLDRFRPSKQFFIEALFEYRRSRGERSEDDGEEV